jgi:hypothetical protein
MWNRARKALLSLVIASVALANGFAPRHAHAAGPLHGSAAAVTSHQHDHQHHAKGAAHHHDGGAHQHENAAAVPCDDSGSSNSLPGSPIHNCCVASCSAVAFIFADLVLNHPAFGADYGFSAAPAARPAPLVSADPPPR